MAFCNRIASASSLRVLSVGSSLSWAFLVITDEESENKNKYKEFSYFASNPSPFFGLEPSSFITKTLQEASLSLNPKPTYMEAASSKNTNDESPVGKEGKEKSPTKKTISYDFIIVGYGNAGQSALRTLQQQCKDAKIAVIDSLRSSSSSSPNTGRNKQTNFYTGTATEFDPISRTVQLSSSRPYEQLQYKHGILIATGARGAPPPLELFEASALTRVLELRSTELLGNMKRPIMPPDKVRNVVVDAAARGGKVGVLGSGWEALDLVCVAEKYGKKKPTVVFGNPGPVWNILPSYLSSELRKKLVRKEIDIHDRSIVRYVADTYDKKSKKLELHTAKLYDLLETRRSVLDLLICAPDCFGAKGTAALPTTEIPERMKESSDGRPWYKTWSQLAKSSPDEPSLIVCFEDDGRISVNPELCAASKVYAAGSVAKYPNSTTGNSTIAGEGVEDGKEAGRVAAINMSKEYTSSRSFVAPEDTTIHSFAASSLPVWRSDITAYPGQGQAVPSMLSSLGIQALCVGQCDSERLATRAFWWTSSSAQRKFNRMVAEEVDNEEGQKLVMNRRRLSRRNRRRGVVSSLYGIGVVYYLDNMGRVRGIMTWGLPFTQEDAGTLNPHMMGLLKKIMITNAGISGLDSEENHQMMNTALARMSQRLVRIAFENQPTDVTGTAHGLDGPIEGFTTPLYRFTEVYTGKSNTMNVLKRKEAGGYGVLGEDLFARDLHALEQDPSSYDDSNGEGENRPANIPNTMYPITVVPFHVEEAYGQKAASLESLIELNRYLATQRGWEENEMRARPGKEDPLWLRPADEKKKVSRKQVIIDAFRSIMFKHRE